MDDNVRYVSDLNKQKAWCLGVLFYNARFGIVLLVRQSGEQMRCTSSGALIMGYRGILKGLSI